MKTPEINTTIKKVAGKKAAKKARTKAASSNGSVQHVVPLGNGWVVKTANSKTFTVITDNKKEAVEIARSIAKTKRSSIVVHGKFGVIERTESFGV